MKTETNRTGELILSEANGQLSRENVKVSGGSGILAAGQVLGMITGGTGYTAFDGSASDGSEVAKGVLYATIDTGSDAGVDFDAVLIARNCEVKEDLLIGSGSEAITSLALLNIITRK